MPEAAAPAAPAEPAAPAGGKKKMMFIIVGVLLIVLLGGAGGAYFKMKGSSGDDEAADAESGAANTAKGGKKAKSAEKKTEKKIEPKAAAIYVGFEPPFVVNFPPDSTVKFLQLTVQIMTREATIEHAIKANDPAIRDALLTLFGQQTAEKLATPEGKEELRAQALQAVRGVIKREGGDAEKVEAVYFTSFVMQ